MSKQQIKQRQGGIIRPPNVMEEALITAFEKAESDIVDEIVVSTPTGYCRATRRDKDKVFTLVPYEEKAWNRPFGVSSRNNNLLRYLIDQPIIMGTEELPGGGVGLIGGPVAGKTYWIIRMYEQLTNARIPCRVVVYREPREPGRYTMPLQRITDDQVLVEALVKFLISDDRVLFIDSMSPYLFMEWANWNTAKFGLNAGAGFWFTDLHDAAVLWGKTIVFTINPYSTDERIVSAFYEFVRGRVGGVMTLESVDSGTYSYRSKQGLRRSSPATAIFAGAARSSNERPNPSDITSHIDGNRDRFIE
jgi:hypothetical protein